MKQILLALITVLFLAAPGFGEPGACLDNSITGDRLMAQQAEYGAARDQVEAIQRGEATATDAELIALVQVECDKATKSWVRAACFCYLGLLKKKAGDNEGMVNAFKSAVTYAKKAQKLTAKKEPNEAKLNESITQGTKYERIAKKALGIK
jgi:hypothetical protein